MAARSILMVRPQSFGPDPETASDNAFQAQAAEEELEGIRAQALQEFDAVVATLHQNGIDVTVVEGRQDQPDDVFPNNWFSTFSDGTLVLYPMKALSRRLERRLDIVDGLLVRYPQLVDMSGWEDRELFLEGTGSLVLDHENRIAFAARSERTAEQLVRNWCADFEFDPILFDTFGPGGKPIYHTNVLLSIGTGYALVCTECIDQPSHVLSPLLTGGREVIEITRGHMMSYCGNVLELQGEAPILLMSSTAHRSFSESQLATIGRFAEPVVLDIPTIEKYGGGGIRCMIAELF